MPRTKLQDIPTKENVALEPEQVVFKPLFARPKAISEMFGISSSTTRRIILEYEKDHKGVENMFYSLSSTLTVINIEKFEEYLSKRHKEWM
ncbi:helix-turn-helix domain-containing protein [Staphylococcus simulans]|uniref:helix-turn-helix domain-containing protein n=1 Tax=Staphylococcus simulans TaxID=1286 RepID=UPI002DBAC5BF|nr:helix-turn-helix domain-containing protein [Staphylococcus simulans]MEB6835691.1 helix-turn-helix domain-containing protein [Staphylococcus simulans]